MKTMLTLICLAMMTGGCADLRVGQPIAEQNVQVLRRGFTTKEEVRKYFGTPLRNNQGPEGEIWVYRYSNGEPNNRPRELTVSFNGNLVSTFSNY